LSKQTNETEMDIMNKITIADTVFPVNGNSLNQVEEFKYLGQILERNDNYWPAISRNLKRARIAWGRIGKIQTKERADVKSMASIYKAIIQAVLLYGAESWVVTTGMQQKLESFHHRCDDTLQDNIYEKMLMEHGLTHLANKS
jgi:hypothetical protein